ncbi:MAG: lipopolysaccharide kinase InaA family protein [Thermodesulfobacteriota bacterium]|nr:lipopolysaccharide kinase InaA family protein [Thermodesulfobacteriota bacterium]
MRKEYWKVFLESNDVVRYKSFVSFMLCNRAYYLLGITNFLKNPDAIFDSENNYLLKRGSKSTVAKIKIGDKNLVVKRDNIKGLWHSLRRFFMTSRSAHSWRNAHRLLTLGIETPRPVALFEKRFGPFRRTAYYICEYAEGPNMIDFFKDFHMSQNLEVVDRIAEVFKKMESSRISHGDMKASNIIIANKMPMLIDLDSMRMHTCKMRFLHFQRKDKERFLKNLSSIPEVDKVFRKLINI